MDEHPYSNRELDNHFNEIKETLSRIEAQTIQTNGRVTKLEGWNQTIKGAATVVTMVATMISGLIIYIYTKDMDILTEKINVHITETR